MTTSICSPLFFNNIVLGFTKKEGVQKSKTLSFDERMLGVGKVNLKITEKLLEKMIIKQY